jgi:magnesium-transporting ATPase (P-type)
MGAGSSATQTVAGLVLENNNFALLPATLNEGRLILTNLRRAAKLFLLKNVYTLFLIVIALGLLGYAFPYLPQQVTLLNGLTIGGPAFLIMLSRRIPTGPAANPRSGFLREVGRFVLSSGLVMGVAGLTIWLISLRCRGDGEETQRTLLLSTLILMGLGNVLLVAEGEARLFWWAALALPVYAAAMYVPLASYFFELTPLDVTQWLLVLAVALPGLGLCVLATRWPIRIPPR